MGNQIGRNWISKVLNLKGRNERDGIGQGSRLGFTYKSVRVSVLRVVEQILVQFTHG